MAATVVWNDAAIQQIIAGIRRGVSKGAVQFQGDVKKRLSRPGRGVQHSGLKYRSSKPGTPPAVQTGTLRRSHQVDLSRLNDAGVARVRIGTNVRYAKWLEFGTSRGMLARPYMSTSLKVMANRIVRMVESEMAAAIRLARRLK